MPYVKENARVILDNGGAMYFPGDLAYNITRLIQRYIKSSVQDQNFTAYNSVVGVLDNVKHEFQRRVLDPYEDKKIIENGDVY